MKKIIIWVVGTAVLAFGYYTISPLFISKTLNEVVPVNTNTTVPTVIDKLSIVTGTKGHPATGTVRIIKTEDKNIVRYENFKTINGPDIYVYLAKDLEANEFVSLGKVKATEGNINYEIPQNINVKDYKYILTWCKNFGVLFNWAEIN